MVDEHPYLLAQKGTPIIELVNLEELSLDQVYEFAFVWAPLKIIGGTGSPGNPIAIY